MGPRLGRSRRRRGTATGCIPRNSLLVFALPMQPAVGGLPRDSGQDLICPVTFAMRTSIRNYLKTGALARGRANLRLARKPKQAIQGELSMQADAARHKCSRPKPASCFEIVEAVREFIVYPESIALGHSVGRGGGCISAAVDSRTSPPGVGCDCCPSRDAIHTDPVRRES